MGSLISIYTNEVMTRITFKWPWTTITIDDVDNSRDMLVDKITYVLKTSDCCAFLYASKDRVVVLPSELLEQAAITVETV